MERARDAAEAQFLEFVTRRAAHAGREWAGDNPCLRLHGCRITTTFCGDGAEDVAVCLTASGALDAASPDVALIARRQWIFSLCDIEPPSEDLENEASHIAYVAMRQAYSEAAEYQWLDAVRRAGLGVSRLDKDPRTTSWRLAEKRAKKLLRKNLTRDQRRDLRKGGYFRVIGGSTGRMYEVHEGRQMNVYELSSDGGMAKGLCFVPQGGLCVSDVMLAQKTALELYEEEALQVADVFCSNAYVPFRARPSVWDALRQRWSDVWA